MSVERPPYEEFIGLLRSALHYLYDPVHLRRSPLVDLLGQSGAAERAAALQRILTDAIRALKPGEEELPQSAAWRIYDTLSLQYIRQSTREVVANQLGISERQLRREQRLALEALAQQLWQKYQLEALPAPGGSPAGVAPAAPVSWPEQAHALSAELDWLKTPDAEELGTLQEILETVQSLAQPLAGLRQVGLSVQIEPGLEDQAVPQMALRSLLLTLLNALIPRVETGPVRLEAFRAGPDLQIDATCACLRVFPSRPEEVGLEPVRQLADFYGASLILRPGLHGASLRFPLPEQVTVLVVDDNADWLAMLTRYAVGSRYRVVTAREPRAASALAEKLQPALIFLDVMMPNVDGWQVLSELRLVHATHSIPVVVCSVLPLADLALSLGVNAFLQKPVTQDQFLAVLDRLLP